jgi:nucleotide-binding universal stress UspA family protein
MNVVIAYDGSNHAKAAIDDLRRAGFPHGGNALVVTVSETMLANAVPSLHPVGHGAISPGAAGMLAPAREEATHPTTEADELSREGVQRVHAHFPRWGVYASTVVGATAETIIQEADDWRADLIVVGSRGRSTLGRLVLGSVSKRVATESRRSVRVARSVVTRGNAPVRVIVGVDGSTGAEAAFHVVALRAWPAGTEARVIAVDDTLRPSISLLPRASAWVSESNRERLAKSRAMLTRAAEALRDAGMHVSTHTPKGSAPDLIAQEAAAWEADCIFVGAQGLTGERLHVGSVSTALITGAACSIELIRS